MPLDGPGSHTRRETRDNSKTKIEFTAVNEMGRPQENEKREQGKGAETIRRTAGNRKPSSTAKTEKPERSQNEKNQTQRPSVKRAFEFNSISKYLRPEMKTTTGFGGDRRPISTWGKVQLPLLSSILYRGSLWLY